MCSVPNNVIIPGLTPNTTYEYQVRGQCTTLQGEFAPSATVTTKEHNENQFSCGGDVPAFEIKTTPLQEPLKINDLIQTADFEITLSKVTANADGSYKGEGFAFLPWLNFASVRVKFHNIRVNTDYRVYSGNVTTIYDTGSRFVANLDWPKMNSKIPMKETNKMLLPV